MACTEPRYCRDCEDDHLAPTDRACPFCGADTIAVSDRDEAAWQRQQDDLMSEPPTPADRMLRDAQAAAMALK